MHHIGTITARIVFSLEVTNRLGLSHVNHPGVSDLDNSVQTTILEDNLGHLLSNHQPDGPPAHATFGSSKEWYNG